MVWAAMIVSLVALAVSIYLLRKKPVAVNDDILAKLVELTEALVAVRNDVNALKAAVANGLTPSQAAFILEGISTAVGTAQQIDASYP